MTPTEFHDIIRPIVFRYGGSVTGGMRTVKRNTAVGGSDDSRHLFDLAADIVLDEPDRIVFVKIQGKKEQLTYNDAFINECMRQGLYAFWHNDHIHTQVR